MSATLAARARSDATLSMPARRPAGRRAPSAPARLLRWFARRPGRGLVVLLFAAVSVLIVLNAVLFQKGRHPAPMLSPPSQSAARPAERRAETPAVAEPGNSAVPAQQAIMPPSRPGALAPAARDAAPRPPAPVAPAQPRQAQAAQAPARPAPAAQPAAARDPIADLINGADIRPPADIRGQRR
ncbi:hypothetical protein B6S44_19725 [Bosea sp. Tri-44]|uniref:hypothetical protein n=1 Tax=Bosea sp. Tri-44 TaxID=1972137 RepID=UPI00100FA24B|nr:hypothetical protein [Bosea sp. Tri-44]RXT52970.1 hypothetical protein B6S44_19725 [Bosea sp. Tri-44]